MTGIELLDALQFADLDDPPPALSDAYRGTDSPDPWLRRRTHAWGGSEAGPLLMAYGLAPLSASPPAWAREQGEHYSRLGVPRIIAWKSGLRTRPAGSTADKEAKQRGHDLEKRLLRRWRDTHARARYELWAAGRSSWAVDPAKVRHATQTPREWFPLVDRRCSKLAITPDAIARLASRDPRRVGGLLALEVKTTYHACAAIPWHYAVQLQAEIATMDCVGGLLIVGEGWQREDGTEVEDAMRGPVRAYAARPDPDMIALIRLVCVEAWTVVEEVREVVRRFDELDADPASTTKSGAKTAWRKREEKAAALRCAELWERSRERMREHRDPAREHLDAVLAEVDGLDELTDYAA